MNRVIFALIFLASSTSFAQFTSSIQAGYTHDSNVFGNFAEVPDNYLSMNLSLENYIGWDYSAFDLSYNGGLSSYNEYPAQDSWNHLLEANYRIQLSRIADDDDTSETTSMSETMPADSLETFLTLYGTLNRALPHSGDFFAYANYNAVGTASFRFTAAQALITHLYYTVNYTGYDELTSLSNIENLGRVVVGILPSNDVYVYLDGSVGTKRYYGVDTVSTAVKNLINMHSKGVLKGKGRGGSQSSQGVRSYVLDSPSASQATYGAGVNYSAGQWGADASLLFRKNLSGTARYINAVAKFAGGQSQVYDDPYSYHGTQFNIGASRDSLVAGINVSAGFMLATKDYNRPALDTSETVVLAKQRRDNYSDLSLALSRSFSSGGFPAGYTIGLNYDHVVNSSNDEFYNFTDDVVSLFITVNLF